MKSGDKSFIRSNKSPIRRKSDKPLSEPIETNGGLFAYLSTTIGELPAKNMMTSSNGNIFRVTGHWCGEFTSHRWIPRQRPVTRSLMFSLICAWLNGGVGEWTMVRLVIRDAIVLITTSP